MATAVQVESLWNGLTDNSGQPLASGKVYTYSAGTSTPVSLYTSSDKSSSATNPLILDGNGKAQVWADGRYKFVVKTSADVTLYTLDNLLYGFDDTTVLLGGTSTGSANAQVVSVPATVESYSNGQRITFIAGYTNTGAATLQFNSLAAINIVKGATPSSLQAGDLIAGRLYSCTYYGGSFRLENDPTPADVQRNRAAYAASISGTNTITGVLTPTLTGYEAGQVVRFKAGAANTSAVTVNFDSLGAKAVQRYGAALVGGEIQANDMVEVLYDGTQFQLVNSVPAPLFVDRTNNRLGIGTTTPIAPLDMAKSLSGIDLAVTKYESGAQGAILHLRKSKNDTIGNNTIVTNGDALGEVYFMGANGSGYTVGASIVAQVDGTPGASNDMPGRIVFSTVPDGSGTAIERMRINNGGGVLINTTSEYSTALSILIRNSLDGGIGIQANTNGNYGMIFRNSSGSQVGRIQIDAAATQYVTSSDYRLKTNVAPMLNGLGKILQLKPCTWDWVNGSGAGQGFIAHELQSIIPEAVSGEKDAVDHDGNIKPQGVDASFVVATTVAAIQQLNDKVEALEARIAALES